MQMDKWRTYKRDVFPLVPESWRCASFFANLFHKEYSALYTNFAASDELVAKDAVECLLFIKWWPLAATKPFCLDNGRP